MVSGNFDIETLIEDALVNALSGISVPVKRWDDTKDLTLSDVVLVKATDTSEMEGTINYYAASNVFVDIGVFSSKRGDPTGRNANSIRGEVRSVIAQSAAISGTSGIVDILNLEDGLNVYNNGVIPQESFDTSDEKNYQKGITVLVVCTTNFE